MRKKIVSLFAAAVIGFTFIPVAQAHATETKAVQQTPAKTIPEFKGKEIDIKVGKDKLKAATEKLKTLESVDLSIKMSGAMQGMDMAFDGKGGLNVKEDKAFFKMSVLGQEIETYYVGGDTYTLENGTWKHSKASGNDKLSDLFKDAKINEGDLKFFDKFAAVEMEDGSVVVKNKEKINSETFKEMLPKDGQAKDLTETFADMANSKMEMDIAFVIDKDDNFKEFHMAGTMDMEGSQITIAADFELSNFNSAAPIVVPEEALKEKN